MEQSITRTERVVAKNLVNGFIACTLAIGTLFYFNKAELQRGWDQKVAPKIQQQTTGAERSIASQNTPETTLNN